MDHTYQLLNQQPNNSGPPLMLLNLLEDGEYGLLKSLHTEICGVNLSVPSVTLVLLDSTQCPKSGHTNNNAPVQIPQQPEEHVMHLIL